MTKLRFAIPIAMLMSTGCLRSTAFHCTSDTQCSSGGPAGKCQTSVGFCSFADPGCPDGQRFGDLADMYANTCVGVIPLIDAGIDAHLIDARLADAQLVSVGGTVTGLTGTGLVLKNNNADPLSVISSGMFTFGMKLAIGSPYSVTIVSPPSGQDAYLAHATGTTSTSPVTNVLVSCFPAGSDPGIRCDTGIFCSAGGSQQCCLDKTTLTGTCQTLPLPTGVTCTNPGVPVPCDSANDCGAGVCCAHIKTGMAGLQNVMCVGSVGMCAPTGGGTIEILCDPNAATPCTTGSCTGASMLGSGYHTCQ